MVSLMLTKCLFVFILSGYGNTAPTTSEGGLLVYTGGFLSIIGFLALNNTAANVWKNLAEDVFLRYKLKWLVKGPLSVLFWCCVLILWVLVLAVSMQRYRRNRTDEDFSLADAYWFSYITSTTGKQKPSSISGKFVD